VGRAGPHAPGRDGADPRARQAAARRQEAHAGRDRQDPRQAARRRAAERRPEPQLPVHRRGAHPPSGDGLPRRPSRGEESRRRRPGQAQGQSSRPLRHLRRPRLLPAGPHRPAEVPRPRPRRPRTHHGPREGVEQPQRRLPLDTHRAPHHPMARPRGREDRATARQGADVDRQGHQPRRLPELQGPVGLRPPRLRGRSPAGEDHPREGSADAPARPAARRRLGRQEPRCVPRPPPPRSARAASQAAPAPARLAYRQVHPRARRRLLHPRLGRQAPLDQVRQDERSGRRLARRRQGRPAPEAPRQGGLRARHVGRRPGRHRQQGQEAPPHRRRDGQSRA